MVELQADVLKRDFGHPCRGVFSGFKIELVGVCEDFYRIDSATVLEGERSFWDGRVPVSEAAVG